MTLNQVLGTPSCVNELEKPKEYYHAWPKPQKFQKRGDSPKRSTSD